MRCLTVVDEATRESLAIICSRGLTAGDVVRTLEQLIEQNGIPQCVRSDNEPSSLPGV